MINSFQVMFMVKYLVSTTMGDSVMDPGYETYVQVTREKFLRKVVGDLKPGDMVLFAKPFTRTDLEDVDPYLTRSPRYAKAKELLHDVDSKGDYVPKLRGMLIRGMANAGVIKTENLESKILYESGNDFSREEYRTMEDYLVKLLEKDGRQQITAAGVRNWLEGTVIAPRNWSLLETLSRNLNPEFSSFHYASEDPAGMYFNYRLYVVLRQGVMRFLNQAKGIKATEGWEEGDYKISLTPEYQIVFDHFLKDFSTNYATARVTKVAKVDRQRQMEHLKETDRLLGNGIVTKLPLHLKLPQKNFPEVMEDDGILCRYLEAAAEDFDCGPIETKNGKVNPTRLTKYTLSRFALPFLLEHFGEELDSRMKTLKAVALSEPEKFGGMTVRESTEYCNRFKDAILLGELDSFLRYDRGTMMRLLEAYFRSHTAIPDRVWDFLNLAKNRALQLIDKQKPANDRELRREIEREAEKISKKYGLGYNELGQRLNGGSFFSEIMLPPEAKSILMSPIEYLEAIKQDRDALLKEVESVNSFIARKPGIFLRTRKYTEDILKQYGLARISDLRRQDFLFEDSM